MAFMRETPGLADIREQGFHKGSSAFANVGAFTEKIHFVVIGPHSPPCLFSNPCLATQKHRCPVSFSVLKLSLDIKPFLWWVM